MKGVGEIARRNRVKVHVDGARIFNAAISLGVEASELVSEADSVSFCLSKGLAAPVGSVVCGSHDFIEEARRARKVLGGGMRQAGILAAAGIVALTEMTERLAEDHDNARRFAEDLAGVEGLSVDSESVKSNIVYINIDHNDISSNDLAERLSREGVLLLPTGPRQMRAVTHYHITANDVEYASGVIRHEISPIGSTMAEKL